MEYRISPNKDHSVLVQQINGFERAKAKKWSTSFFTHLGWIGGLHVFNILLGPVTLFAFGFSTGWMVVTSLSSAMALAAVIAWRHEVYKMRRPEGEEQQRNNLRKILMEAHSLLPNILPTVQNIDQHINTADVVWMKFVQHTLEEYIGAYSNTQAINMQAYEQIMAQKCVNEECDIVTQHWMGAVDSEAKSVM